MYKQRVIFDAGVTVKRCNECQQTKPMSFFRPDGKGRCLACWSEYDQKKTSYITGQAQVMLSDAKKRAKLKGIVFDLDIHWLVKKLMSGKCEATGTPYKLSARNGREVRRMDAPSLDRIDSSGGYTRQNTRVVIYCYNAARNAGGDALVLKMAKHLVARELLGYGDDD